MNFHRSPSAVLGPTSARLLLLVVGAVLALLAGAAPAQADPATPPAETTPIVASAPTATPIPTATSTLTPTPAPTPTPKAGPTPTPRKQTVVRRKETRRHRQRPKRATPAATPTPTETPVPERAVKRHEKRHAKRQHHHRAAPKHTPTPTATPSPTPTPTQPITLSTEDTITPVTCNGPAKPLATHPFLLPPFAGWNSIVSYFDHDSPNFARDGLVVAATGLMAQPDQHHHVSDFPAYWSRSLRQYVYYDGHNGYDYDLWYQPVYAAAAGKVIFADMEYSYAPDHGYGNMVMIKHARGYVTLYGHFSKILVKAGQKVRAGQKIGISGNTGHSSGPHLHFTVFHNCTPTDPYGWSGPGQDPLADYKGETSVYLWVRPPLVVNPVPGFPGLSLLPAASTRRLVLLRLPSTRRGTTSFTAALRREAERAVDALGRSRPAVKIDMLRGALEVRGEVAASRLYALPGVASVATADAASDARADVLSALAKAALSTPHHVLHLAHRHDWTGYLLEWQGRAILVGKGPKAKQVKLRLPHLHHGTVVRRIQTDPTNGAYAVDLGAMSSREVASLAAELQGHREHHVSASVQPAKPRRAAAIRRSVAVASSRSLAGPAVVGLLLLLAAGALATVLRARGVPGIPRSE